MIKKTFLFFNDGHTALKGHTAHLFTLVGNPLVYSGVNHLVLCYLCYNFTGFVTGTTRGRPLRSGRLFDIFTRFDFSFGVRAGPVVYARKKQLEKTLGKTNFRIFCRQHAKTDCVDHARLPRPFSGSAIFKYAAVRALLNQERVYRRFSSDDNVPVLMKTQ